MARVLYWFRTDLRLHDSPALKAALDLNPECLYPVWTWDPEYVYNTHVGPNRWQFLLDSMNDVSEGLTKLNKKSRLLVVRGSPLTIIPELLKQWKITHVVFEKDHNGYAKERDAKVVEIAKKLKVDIVSRTGRSLFDPEEVVKRNHNASPLTMRQLLKAIDGLPPPSDPIDAPKIIPPPGDLTLKISRKEHPVDMHGHDLNKDVRPEKDTQYDTICFDVPTMEELGVGTATSQHRGGEKRGLAQLDTYCKDKKAVATFQKPKTNPAAFDPPETTFLSAYLKFGCVSVRLFLKRVNDIIKESKNASSMPENLPGQLYFREMYIMAEYATPHFGQMKGNPICRVMDWELQNEYGDNGDLVIPRPRGAEEAEEWFERWSTGHTGFPWIDALMRQLRQEGWIHHLGRHSVACFLTRGHCYISWERGAEVFDKFLIDWDPASNPGNWMWLSASAFFHDYYRVYSPVAFGKKWDKHGNLIRKYVPELAKFPEKYIYEPWKAPKLDQKEAGCIIGQDYPKPMLDEKVQKEKCLQKMREGYGNKVMGDAVRPEVTGSSKSNGNGNSNSKRAATTESIGNALKRSKK